MSLMHSPSWRCRYKWISRKIKIIRNNKIIQSVDIYNYLMSGKPLDDIRLLDQDVIFVPPRKSTIPITGAVKRPGYYEILNIETLKDLIYYAGEFNRRSSKSTFYF